MPINTQRRDNGEAPPKVATKPIDKPRLPKDYGDMKKNVRRP